MAGGREGGREGGEGVRGGEGRGGRGGRKGRGGRGIGRGYDGGGIAKHRVTTCRRGWTKLGLAEDDVLDRRSCYGVKLNRMLLSNHIARQLQ